MADKPIIFSAPMVRALLDGRKTQTRRALKPAKYSFQNNIRLPDGANAGEVNLTFAPRDRLYVREAWRVGAWEWQNAHIAVDYCDGPRKEWLHVDDGDMFARLVDQSRGDAKKAGAPLHDSYYEYSWPPGGSPCRWRPSIHMPRWASRLTLIVTDVRVQRLQEISETDARAEGAIALGADESPDPDHRSFVWGFSTLWNSLHGPDAWDANPWVVALTFTVHRCNIDQMENADG